MSKDYRYQREEWDPVESDDQDKRLGDRRHLVKSKQKRDLQRREKQRRLHHEEHP